MKHIKNLAIVVAILIGIQACKENPKDAENPIQEVVETSNSQETLVDTVIYDEVYYPDDTTFLAKILIPGTFHEDEVWEGADRLKWYGLFHKGADYYLSETRIRTPRVNDVIVDESEDEKTGWNVEPLHPDTPILLIAGLNFLKNKSVQRISLDKYSLIPGDTLKFNYLGMDYRLYAGGNKRKHDDGGEWYELWNYRLYFAAKLDGKWVEDLLVATPHFDDAMIIIQFAGDIDGDKKLDLLIDTSNHYNADCPTLYLSKPADKGHIIKIVGMHCSVGC